MLFQRWVRRIDGFFKSIYYYFWQRYLSTLFKIVLKSKGIDDKYLFDSFCYFANLSMKEPMFAGDLSVYGCGYYFELKSPSFHYTTQWSPISKQLVIHEWRDTPRKVRLEMDFEGETHWHEIYRSQRFADYGPLIKYIAVVKKLYGNGENQCLKQMTE